MIVTTSERQRHAEQNRFYWGVVLRSISDYAWVNGRRFDRDAWHVHYSRKFGICEDKELPTGEVVVRRKSTSGMSVSEFSTYLDQVQADAAEEHGVVFR